MFHPHTLPTYERICITIPFFLPKCFRFLSPSCFLHQGNLFQFVFNASLLQSSSSKPDPSSFKSSLNISKTALFFSTPTSEKTSLFHFSKSPFGLWIFLDIKGRGEKKLVEPFTLLLSHHSFTLSKKSDTLSHVFSNLNGLLLLHKPPQSNKVGYRSKIYHGINSWTTFGMCSSIKAKNAQCGRVRPRLRGWNEMERNEKNNFRVFFPFLVWEF